MARVQYGTIVTALKGNVGGQTFQNGNISKVLRNKGYRAGSSSVARNNAVRNIVSQSARWRTLTDLQRAGWYSVRSFWPFTDKYGNSYLGSGYQVFVAWNSALEEMGYAVLDLPDTSQGTATVSPDTCQYAIGVGLSVSWDSTIGAPMTLQIFASPPMSPGRNNNNAKFRLIGNADPAADTSITFATEYDDIFGTPPEGSKIVVKVQNRGNTFSRILQLYTQSCIVTV